MKQKILILFLFSLVPFLVFGQSIDRERYPDIDLYNRQVVRNRCDYITERRRHLLRTLPFDTLATRYIQKRYKGAILDTVSMLDYFEFNRTPLGPEEQERLVDTYYDAARRYNNPRLRLAADLVRGKAMNNYPELFEEQMEWYETMVRRATKAGEANMVATLLTEMWSRNFYHHRYARSFEYAARLDEALARTDEDYPYKGLQYIWLGIAYQRFKEYDRALHYYHKGLSYRHPSHELFAGNYLRAWRYLSDYHMATGNLDSAAHYNRVLLGREESVVNYIGHANFAIANLGRIEMRKGNYPAAIVLMEVSMKNMARDNGDRYFLSRLHVTLGECYLHIGNPDRAKYHLDQAPLELHLVVEEDYREEFLKEWYALRSKYYSARGNQALARQYLDSALVTGRNYERLTGRHVIGIFMVDHGTTNVSMSATNKQHNVANAASGTFAPESGHEIYYPQTGAVNFVAYYPYKTSAALGAPIDVTIGDQSNQPTLACCEAETGVFVFRLYWATLWLRLPPSYLGHSYKYDGARLVVGSTG